MSILWSVECAGTHGEQEVWADSKPVMCPVDPNDGIVPDSETVLARENLAITIIPHRDKIKSHHYTRIISTIYDTELHGPLSRVLLLAKMESTITSYDVEIYDKTNHTSLITANFNNTGDYQRIVVGPITSPPTGLCILEVNVKKNGGNKKKYVRISQVMFMSHQY